MNPKRLPSLEELGLVGKLIRELYKGPGSFLAYDVIVERFNDAKKELPPSHLPIFEVFNPAGVRTQSFFSAVRQDYSHVDLQSVVNAILRGDSVPQKVIAEGIMDNRLNLPHPIYAALEQTYLPRWEEFDLKDMDFMVTFGKIGNNDYEHVRTLHDASRRYQNALIRLDAAIKQSTTDFLRAR